MNLNTPQIAHLKSMLALHEKRAHVQQELDAIDHELSKLQTQLGGGISSPAVSAPSVASAPQKRGPRAQRGGSARGALKARIFAALEQAGATGVKVAPLADALGTKSANIYAWFHSAAKRYKGIINKIGSAHYRLDGKLPGDAPAKTPKAAKAPKLAKAPKTPKAAKTGGSPRGYLMDGIIATLKAAGPQGVTIKEIAAKLGVGYKNIAVWFATTGRKNTAIRKMAPAKYQIVS
jgi:hypothetical protein